MKTGVIKGLLLQQLLFAALGVVISADSAIAVGGDSDAGAQLSIFCAYCHGSDGNPFYPGAPRLAGQDAATLVTKMKARRKCCQDDRSNMMMVAFFTAGCLNDRDIGNLAAYFSKQTVRSTPSQASEGKVK